MVEETNTKSLCYLPTPPLRPFVRGFCSLLDGLRNFGVRQLCIGDSKIRRLLDNGTALALRVEGEDWMSEGNEIHCLWEATIKSLSESIRERNQHAVARLIVYQALKFYLERRIRVYEYLLDNPSIVEIEIKAPLVIAGLPRTGSTLLHRLLASDSNARAYRYWELTSPVPSPKPNASMDRRIWQLKLAFGASNFFVAGHREEIAAFHMSSPTTVEEDTVLMWSMGLMNPITLLHGNEELHAAIFSPAGRQGSYRFLRRCFQILNAKYPPGMSLRLKSPFHTLYLQALFSEFPDARIISLHREPKDVVESWLSFVARLAIPTFRHNSIKIEEFVQPQVQFLEKSSLIMTSLFGESKTHQARNHLALSFEEFVKGPLKTVEGIYKHFDLGELGEEDKSRMQAFLSQKAAQKTLLPKYKLPQLGLDSEQIGKRFLEYRKIFGYLF
tara:strand:+ start:202 stop:1530 length:1329 start_codon:yes stop_codon:yes gene_type:complete